LPQPSRFAEPLYGCAHGSVEGMCFGIRHDVLRLAVETKDEALDRTPRDGGIDRQHGRNRPEGRHPKQEGYQDQLVENGQADNEDTGREAHGDEEVAGHAPSVRKGASTWSSVSP